MEAGEKLIIVFPIVLFVLSALLYIYPELFFMYYDKILYFLEVL
jgi:hypothetical protein